MSWRDIVRKSNCTQKMGCGCDECMNKGSCPHCDGNAPRSECICGHTAKGAKPDYIDIDGDGNRTESMKEAARQKKMNKAMPPLCANKPCLRPANGTDGYGFCMPCEDDASENRLTDPNSPYTRENMMKRGRSPFTRKD